VSEPRFSHPDLELVARRLAQHPGKVVSDAADARRAAVALMLRDHHGTLELLLIKRAEFESDPWSGHVALPGGRSEPGDRTLEDTVIRETREEIAIDIARDGTVIGTLDEVHPRTPVLPPVVVRPYVVAINATVTPVPSVEVAEAFWIAVDLIRDPAAWQETAIPVRGVNRNVMSYRHGPHVIWGLTERVLSNFVALLGGTA
jgi:8-oxo-dGTP pyrophosphatase MutT (NUDIX family)